MSEHKQLLESLLAELKAALTEPYASDQAKVIDIESVARRYRFFMENLGSFEATKRIMDKARGTEI
jgi:hypothetical protein